MVLFPYFLTAFSILILTLISILSSLSNDTRSSLSGQRGLHQSGNMPVIVHSNEPDAGSIHILVIAARSVIIARVEHLIKADAVSFCEIFQGEAFAVGQRHDVKR
ncbi:hypothetical protein SDC9_147015 [bioreactor metagenome]|uniref:Uncharacterized protein n=1 Tax=bioreactor metagenome TaxID=1076179 RepID=A0A645ED98_9ZZZZ